MSPLSVREIERRQSVLGEVLYVKILATDCRPLSWREVWEKFADTYPGKWAVQCFPPANQLVDGKAVYHLFVCDKEPAGLNIRPPGI